MRRNLYFHLYPLKRSFWTWHLDQLRLYWNAFNGRKIVVVAVDGRTASAGEVAARLQGLDVELREVRNDPARGETSAFIDTLRLLESSRPDEATFYAHGKGVTHRGLGSLIMQSWSEAMYFMNLSDVGLVDELLAEHAAVGCFRQEVPHAGSQWHFSGTFFWFKHSQLYARDWERIHRGKYGVEGYLGRHLPVERSFCLTPYRHFGALYDHVVTRRECRRWLRALRTSERALA